MSDKIKITELETLDPVAGEDWVPVVDVNDTTDGPGGTTKKATKNSFKGDQGDPGNFINLYEGAWSAGTYTLGQLVTHNGSSYIAVVASTTEEPGVGVEWDLVAQKGDTGDTGDTGPTGPQGPDGDFISTWTGAWSAGTYTLGQVAEHNGTSYVVVVASTTEEPGVGVEWEIVAQAGESFSDEIGTEKTGVVDADRFGILDSAASLAAKYLTFANLKAAIKTYYDAVTATLTNKTLTAPVLTGTTTADRIDLDRAVLPVNSIGNLGATETFDWSTHSHFRGVLDANITIDFSNAVAGQKIQIDLAYTGALRTIAWTPTIKWGGGAAPTGPDASGEVLVVSVSYNGTEYLGSYEIFA